MSGEFGPGIMPATHVLPTKFRLEGGRFRQLKARRPIDVWAPAFLFPRGLNQSMKSKKTRLSGGGEIEGGSAGQVSSFHAADC